MYSFNLWLVLMLNLYESFLVWKHNTYTGKKTYELKPINHSFFLPQTSNLSDLSLATYITSLLNFCDIMHVSMAKLEWQLVRKLLPEAEGVLYSHSITMTMIKYTNT